MYMAPGNQYMAGLTSGAQTIGSGQQMQLGGLGNILNAQTSIYNQGQQGGLDVGGLLAGGAQLYTAFGSDRRLKENIEWVGRDDVTGLPLYEFNYIEDPDTRWRGFMADEVKRLVPEAVIEDENGYMYVNYGMLGTDMVEVSHAA